MSVDQEALSTAIMLFDVFLQELVSVQQERKATLEKMEQARTEQERLKLQEKLRNQTDEIREKTTKILKQNKKLFDNYENSLPGFEGEVDPETEVKLQSEFLNARNMEELYNRPQRNRWLDRNGRTDLLSLSKPAIDAYFEICQKADERKTQTITGARQMISDETIIAEEIANVDYPEKAADLELIGQLRTTGIDIMDALRNSIDDIGITKYIMRFSRQNAVKNKANGQIETLKNRRRQESPEGQRTTSPAQQEQKSEATKQYSGTTQAERQQAAAIAEYINALENPGRLTVEDQVVVDGAKERYDALPENVKSEVDTAAVQKLDALTKEMDQLVANNNVNSLDEIKKERIDEELLEKQRATIPVEQHRTEVSAERRPVIIPTERQQETITTDIQRDNEQVNRQEVLDNVEGQRAESVAEKHRMSDSMEEQGEVDFNNMIKSFTWEKQVEMYIDALKNPGELAPEDQEAVYGVKTLYDALIEDVKSKIDSNAVQKLDKLVNEIDRLVAGNEETQTYIKDGNNEFDNVSDDLNNKKQQEDETVQKASEQGVNIQQDLNQNSDVNQLLDILEVNDRDGKIELESLLSYVEGMEKQVYTLTKVTEALREEIKTMHDSPEKQTLQQSEQFASDQAKMIRTDVRTIKEKIIHGCKEAIERFKLNGKRALNNVMKFFNVRESLDSLNRHVINGLTENTKTLNEIDEITAEFGEAKQHLKNVENKILGRDVQTVEKGPGMISKAIKTHFQTERKCLTTLQTNVEKALAGLDRLAEVSLVSKNNNENEAMVNLQERHFENLWPDQEQKTDLLTLSKPEVETLVKVCSEADQFLPYKEAERPIPFELVVLDTLANKDYPEKQEDLHRLSIMNQGDESIQKTLVKEDWPQLYAGMNLKAGAYIPDQEKKGISIAWMENKHDTIQKNYQYYENLSKDNPNNYEYKLQKQLQKQTLDFVGSDHKNWDDDKVEQKMKEFHDQAVLVEHTARYVGSEEESVEYQEKLRQDIIKRYELEKGIENPDVLKQMIANEYMDTSGEMSVKLNRLEALRLYEQGVSIFDGNQNYRQIEAIEELLDYKHFHQFTCSSMDLQNMLQKDLGETQLQDIPVDYRTEIEPLHGTSESINELSAKKQPTAASVRDELEEDVVYGIGEVGDSNQLLIEEETETEEISIGHGLRP